MHTAEINVATESIHLAPYKSSNLPINGPVRAPEALLADMAQPKEARPIPKSSPIGLMYKPKLRDPIPMLTALVMAITATITQP